MIRLAESTDFLYYESAAFVDFLALIFDIRDVILLFPFNY
jgi:hypothetical protein